MMNVKFLRGSTLPTEGIIDGAFYALEGNDKVTHLYLGKTVNGTATAIPITSPVVTKTADLTGADLPVGTLVLDATELKIVNAAHELVPVSDNVESIAQLEATVNALSQKVGTIPEGATATTVVGYVDERVGTIPEGSDNVVDYVDKKIAAIPAQTDYTVTITTPTESSVSKRYNIKQVATGLDVNIDIPKDMVVSSGTVETKAEAGAWGPAGTYLVLTLANATSDKVYINVGDLIEYVVGGTATDGIITTTVTIDGTGNHVLTATINDGTITLTKLAEDIQTAIGKAHTHTNNAVLDGITADKVAGWDTAATDAHTHANKTVLDGITAEKVSNWDAAQANVLEGITSSSLKVGTITNKKVAVDIEWGTF